MKSEHRRQRGLCATIFSRAELPPLSDQVANQESGSKVELRHRLLKIAIDRGKEFLSREIWRIRTNQDC